MEKDKKHSSQKRLKPLKNVNSVDRSLRFKAFAIALFPLSIIGAVYGGLKGFLIGIGVSILAGFLTVYLSGLAGRSIIDTFFGMRKGRWSLQERMEGTMNIARKYKRNKQYPQARATVDEVLTQSPDDTEALFLKAQILWEGFQATQAARTCLRKIVRLQPDDTATLHRWAVSLMEEIDRADRKRS